MKLTIAATALTNSLTRAVALAKTRTTIDILRCALFTATENALTVSATDTEITITDRLPCVTQRLGSYAINCQAIHDILRNMPSGDVTIEVSGERVHIRGANYKASLATQPADTYPVTKGGDLPTTFSMDAKAFSTLLGKVEFAQSDDTTRQYLRGVHMHVTAEPPRQFRLVATNGITLALAGCDVPDNAADMPPIMVPREAARHLSGMLKDAADAACFAVSDRRLEVTLGATTLSTKLIDGQFPDYERIIPAATGPKLRVMREPFLAALNMASSLRSNAVVLEISTEEVIVRSACTDEKLGDAEARLGSGDMEYDGEPLRVGFNSGYIRAAFLVTDGDVEISLKDALSPALITHVDDPEFRYVVVPLKV